MPTHRTTCPLDCPDACLLEVTVSNGQVTGIDGSHDDPVTAGFICSKVRGFARRQHGAHRLTSPLRRTGPKGAGTFAPISWDEAVDEITDRFRHIASAWGAEAILPYHYGGSNGLVTDGTLDELYFGRLGASRLAKTLCAVPTTSVALAMYGKMPGVAFRDFVHANCIVVWGANPTVSNIHLVPFIKAAKARGAFVAVVDPVRNLAAGAADLHLAVLPGTDLTVALALIRCWHQWAALDQAFLATYATGAETLLEAARAWPLERAAQESGVPAETIEQLARELMQRNPAVVRCGWGVERNRNGGQAVAAILAIPALLGKFGVRGGGYALSNNGAAKVERDALPGRSGWNTRVVNMTQLGEVLTGDLEPPIKGLFVYNCNPAVTVPDQDAVLRGLAREDLFTVVFDQLMTDSARYADVILPATTFLEHVDLRASYGNYVVGKIEPLIDPAGEAKSNVEVFGLLGRRMGFADEPFGWDGRQVCDRILGGLKLGGKGIGKREPDSVSWQYDFPGPTPVMFETVFPRTSDTKIHLAPEVLGTQPYQYRPLTSDYPLALISPATSRTINSTMGEYAIPELYIEIHPDDASARGVADGASVRVFNELSEVVCRARLRTRVRPGVVMMPKGAWQRSAATGRTVTALCPATVSDVGGGACYNDARVQVAGAERAPHKY
jgi:anaerobic selenocysteine-containing dehydrogenase